MKSYRESTFSEEGGKERNTYYWKNKSPKGIWIKKKKYHTVRNLIKTYQNINIIRLIRRAVLLPHSHTAHNTHRTTKFPWCGYSGAQGTWTIQPTHMQWLRPAGQHAYTYRPADCCQTPSGHETEKYTAWSTCCISQYRHTMFILHSTSHSPHLFLPSPVKATVSLH